MRIKDTYFAHRPWLAMAAVISTFALLQVSSSWFLYSVLGLEKAIEFDQSRAMIALLLTAFVVAPYVLYLPKGRRGLVPMIEEIKLFQDRPIGRLLWLALSSYAILALCQVGGVIAVHLSEGGILDAEFYETAFSTAGYFSTMTFILAFPPVLEEVVFRGIVLTTFRNMYGPVKAVIFSALGFGLVQLVFLVEGNTLLVVAGRVLVAFLMGVFYGVLYLRAGSLLPNVLFRYLNGLLGAYLTGYLFTMPVSAGTRLLFEVTFINGLIPVALMVLWVLGISGRIAEKREEARHNILEQLEPSGRKD